MAVKVKIDPTNALRAIKKAFKQTKTKKSLQVSVAKFIKDRVVAFARAGKNMKLGQRLPKLSKSYMDMRLGAVKFRTINGKVVAMAEPDEALQGVDKQYFDPTLKRSNLTFTGQLLRSLIAKVEGDKMYLILKDGRDDGKTNSQILEYLKELNALYDFLPKDYEDLDKTTRKRVNRLVIEELRRELRRNNLK